jgi:hypothetical protein
MLIYLEVPPGQSQQQNGLNQAPALAFAATTAFHWPEWLVQYSYGGVKTAGRSMATKSWLMEADSLSPVACPRVDSTNAEHGTPGRAGHDAVDCRVLLWSTGGL